MCVAAIKGPIDGIHSLFNHIVKGGIGGGGAL